MLFSFNTDGARLPLVLLHGLYGFLPYRRGRMIADHLGPDRQIHALEAPGFAGPPLPARTITEIVQAYQAELASVGVSPPYLIAAVCEGCFFALEMARLLALAGTPSPLVLLIDPPGTPPIGVGEEKLTPAVARHFRDHARAWFVEAVERAQEVPFDLAKAEEVERAAEVAVATVFAVARYKPLSYSGRIDVIATGERAEQISRADWPWRRDVLHGVWTLANLKCTHQELFSTGTRTVFHWLSARIAEIEATSATAVSQRGVG